MCLKVTVSNLSCALLLDDEEQSLACFGIVPILQWFLCLLPDAVMSFRPWFFCDDFCVCCLMQYWISMPWWCFCVCCFGNELLYNTVVLIPPKKITGSYRLITWTHKCALKLCQFMWWHDSSSYMNISREFTILMDRDFGPKIACVRALRLLHLKP